MRLAGSARVFCVLGHCEQAYWSGLMEKLGLNRLGDLVGC